MRATGRLPAYSVSIRFLSYYIRIVPQAGSIAHFNYKFSACCNILVLNVWQAVLLAIQLYALYVNVLIAVVYRLYGKCSAFNHNIGTLNRG